MKTKYSTFWLLLSLFAFASCGKKATQAVEPTDEAPAATSDRITLTPNQVNAIGIQTGQITQQSIRATINAIGVLDVPPQNMVSISSTFGGFLKSTTLLPGTKVAQGQLIATMEHPDFVTMQQEYLENKSQLTFLEAEYQRQTALAAENVNAKKTLEKARADFETMKARIAGQHAKLEMLHIDLLKLEKGEIVKTAPVFSPIAGYVTEMHVNVGSFVQPSDVLFKIADTGHLHAELTVYEKDINSLSIGQKVMFQVGGEGKERIGSIHLLGREVGPDRSVKVHVHFETEDPSLIPGTYLKAKIETTKQDVPALPEKAIVHFEGGDYVFLQVAGDTTYELVPVEIGLTDNGFTEVLNAESLAARGKIVTEGAFGLLAKLKNTDEE